MRQSEEIHQKKCIYIPQGRIARFIGGATPAGIDGIFSSRFFNCNLLVLINTEEKKYSLIHVDVSYVDEKQLLLSEIEWVGKKSKKIVYRRNNEHAQEIQRDVLDKLGQKIEIKIVQEVGGIAIINGKVEFYKTVEDFPILLRHPFEKEMTHIGGFNCQWFFEGLTKPNIARIIFNGYHWIKPLPDELQLTKFSQQKYAEIKSSGITLKKGDLEKIAALKHKKFQLTGDINVLTIDQRIYDAESARKIDALNNTDYLRKFRQQVFNLVINTLPNFKINSLEYNYANLILLAISINETAYEDVTILIARMQSESDVAFKNNIASLLTSITACLKSKTTTNKESFMRNAEEIKQVGNQLAGKKDYKGALAKYNEAVQVDPTLAAAWLNKGLMHKELKEYAEALTAFEQTLKLDPNYVKAQYNRGEILRLQGKYRDAWEQFNSLLNAPNQNKNIDALTAQFVCEQHAGAKIIFANVDLKLTKDNQVKILEFGRGIQSGFIGLQIATQQNIKDLLAKTLQELALPRIILESEPGSEFVDEKLFTEVLPKIPMPTAQFQFDTIKTYRAIYASYHNRPVDKNFLLLDDGTVNFSFEDKLITHEAFIASNQQTARPRTLILERSYHKSLVKEIRQQLTDTKQFIIKVPDMERGQGVVVINNEDLDITLYYLLTSSHGDEALAQELEKRYVKHFIHKHDANFDNEKMPSQLEADMNRFDVWKNSDSLYFLVEEYITSKPIIHENRIYDPTMRVAFLFVRDSEKILCKPFACYWKLPPQAVNAKTILRDKAISSFSETRHDAVAVSHEDQQLVYQYLQTVLPEVIQAMIKRDIPVWIEAKPATAKSEKDYKAYLWMHYANSLAHLGQYVLAEYYVNKAKILLPEHFKLHHELGVIYHLQGNYQKALEHLNIAVTKHPNNSATRYRRGQTLYVLGEIIKAKEDFKKAIELNPRYKQQVEVFLQLKQSTKSEEEVKIREFTP